MCGRYSLALQPQQIQYQMGAQNMPVDELVDEDLARQSYNMAPTYMSPIYRARSHANQESEVTESERSSAKFNAKQQRLVLQSMKWGLVPFWNKRPPDYGSTIKTINCRDDSLYEGVKSMWSSMKQKKRCVVIAQGYYEWLKKGREKLPHFIKRKDGQLMSMLGLYDSVQFDDSKSPMFTYSIVTTSAASGLTWLHDRMPVIIANGSEGMQSWLDANMQWTPELQNLLRPYDATKLECYPVSKEVGKVGNNSPDFIIPLDSSANKSNIANFFKQDTDTTKQSSKRNYKEVSSHEPRDKTIEEDSNAPLPSKAEEQQLESDPKRSKSMKDPTSNRPQKVARKHSVDSVDKSNGSSKITQFFGKGG